VLTVEEAAEFLDLSDGFAEYRVDIQRLHSVYTTPFKVPGSGQKMLYFIGATRRIRTDDLLITNQLLYRLS
jgi:hypothetical protein